MSARVLAACVLGTLLGGNGQCVADEGPNHQLVVVLTDGGRLVGTIVRKSDATLTVRTTSGLELDLARSAVARIEPSSAQAPPELAPPEGREPSEPNDTRLMFAPTGRPLHKGDGYFSDHYVIFPGFAYGLTDNVSVSGGLSTIPGVNIDEQLLYVSSSVGWRLSPRAAVSLGGLYATGSSANEAGALLFGVASFGPVDRSLSVGVGLAATRNTEYFSDPLGNVRSESRWSWRDTPVLMVGGTFKVGKRLSLVTESWLFPGRDFELASSLLGWPLASSASAFRWMSDSSSSPRSSRRASPSRGSRSPTTSALREARRNVLDMRSATAYRCR